MQMRSKKGMHLETLIEIVIFVLITLLIGLPLGAKIMEYFMGTPDSGTTKSLDLLAKEINLLEENETRTVPAFIDKTHIIKTFGNNSKSRPYDCEPKLKGENRKACICICKAESCDAVKKEVNECKNVDFNFAEENVLGPKLDKKGKEAIVQNCAITKLEGFITISCS